MRIRMLVVPALLVFAVPVWAHCGKCGVGEAKGEEQEKGGHHAAEGEHGHGHDHAHAEIGKPAPDFTLKGIDGKEYKLSDMKGKVVVLEWTNHECPFVKRVHRDGLTMDVVDEFEGKPVVWMAIDSSHFCEQKSDSIRTFAEEMEVPYPILLDASGTVGHQYAAKTTPHMFVIDQKGVLAYSGALDDDPTGEKDEARNYVAEAVSALLDGSAVPVAQNKSYGCSVKYKS